MTLETKIVSDTVKATARLAEAALKKAWSIMEAAAEKKPPSEYLSQNAVRAIQGAAGPPNRPGG
jgi:hypothetical protein